MINRPIFYHCHLTRYIDFLIVNHFLKQEPGDLSIFRIVQYCVYFYAITVYQLRLNWQRILTSSLFSTEEFQLPPQKTSVILITRLDINDSLLISSDGAILYGDGSKNDNVGSSDGSFV
jgi:hypothetical protein